MTPHSDGLDDLIGRVVVLDAAGQYVYSGTLAGRSGDYLVLEEADVHDLRDTASTRELYVLELKRHGVNPNRRRVLVRRDEIVSLAALEDIQD